MRLPVAQPVSPCWFCRPSVSKIRNIDITRLHGGAISGILSSRRAMGELVAATGSKLECFITIGQSRQVARKIKELLGDDVRRTGFVFDRQEHHALC